MNSDIALNPHITTCLNIIERSYTLESVFARRARLQYMEDHRRKSAGNDNEDGNLVHLPHNSVAGLTINFRHMARCIAVREHAEARLEKMLKPTSPASPRPQ